MGTSRPNVSFTDFAYLRPDIDAIYAQLDEQIAKMAAATSAQEAYTIFTEESISLGDYLTMYTVAMLRNCADVNDPFYAEEYAFLNDASVQISSRQAALYETMLAAPYAEDLSSYFGEKDLEAMRRATQLTSSEAEPLLRQEAELEQQYIILAGSATITVDGVEYGYADIGSIPGLDAESYWNYIDEFFTIYNQKLGDIFLKLIEVRDEIANLLGYDSFVELGYLRMGRTSYTQQDVMRLRYSIGNYVSPYVNGLYDDVYTTNTLNLLPDPSPVPDMDADELIDACKEVWARISSDAKSCSDLMDQYELVDLKARQSKDVSTFTTYVDAYKAPYIFAHISGYNAYDVTTLNHEFGHAFAYYRQTERMGVPDFSQTYDISEIFSGTMELLALPFYETFYGDDAETAVSYALIGILESLLTSVVYDEFNERIYTELPETIEEINMIYAEVLERYVGNDFTRAYDTSCGGRFWVLIPHFFSAPFYSIDYALADLVALQIWQQAENDPEGAFQSYESLIDLAYGVNFTELIEAADLQNPFDDKVVKELVSAVVQTIEKQSGRQPDTLAA